MQRRARALCEPWPPTFPFAKGSGKCPQPRGLKEAHPAAKQVALRDDALIALALVARRRKGREEGWERCVCTPGMHAVTQ